MMEPVEYKARAEGGFVRVHRYENGVPFGDGMSFNSRKVAERVARELNVAVATGVRLAHAAVQGDPPPEGEKLTAQARIVAGDIILRLIDQPVV
jgi:hypothetical protein